MPQPGCVSDGACESSVSSAWPSMPFACAALTALVTIREPITVASGVPPWVLMNEIAFSPGSRRDPDTMAAIVSSTWCLVFSFTGFGSGFLPALAM
jgi:hypothetical protein